MKLTPLPLTVLAMTQVGWPSRGGWLKASVSSAKSCPFTVRTVQPNARNFSSSGSLLQTSRVRPVICKRVVVEDGGEVVELVMRGGHGGFPVGAFGQFAVAQQREDAVAGLVHLPGQRQPTEIGRPWPSAPVFISMPGTLRVG